MTESKPLPLDGVRVVEFVHMVMGPTCGMVLGDFGADVIKVEPIAGDNTRRLPGSGSGFFIAYNRNKRSISVDLKSPAGKQVVLDLVRKADVVTENFRPGGMAALGLGYDDLKAINPGLIYASLKGFLPGPYEHRKALDEVVQMMGGLAYMTGPPGRPLRAGCSLNDMMGGMFAALGIMAALRERDRTGEGQYIQSSLFENNVFLVGQHMAQYSVTGQAPQPMPNRLAAWAVYDIFETADDNQLFVGIVTDTQWKLFCDRFARPDLFADPRLKTNPMRCAERPWLIPEVAEVFRKFTKAELEKICEETELPYAPITRPEELFDDPHLAASGALVEVTNPEDGRRSRVPTLPVAMRDGLVGKVRRDVPRKGEHTRAVLQELGYDGPTIDRLLNEGAVAAEPNRRAAE